MSSVSERLICRRDLRWKWQALHSAVMWALKVRFESMTTQRLVIWSESSMSVSYMWIDGVAGKVRSRWCVPKSIASDLSGLRERPLKQSQEECRVDRHVSRWEMEVPAVYFLKDNPLSYPCDTITHLIHGLHYTPIAIHCDCVFIWI